MRTAIAVAVLAATMTITLAPSSAAPETQSACAGFRWFNACWTKNEGEEFAAALRQHGVSPQEFKRNHPELAATFTKPWPPPKQYWKTCVTGARCAQAVIAQVFGGNWQYAYRIAGCETGGTYSNRATGSAGERGLFQIHPVHFGWLDEGQLWDVRYNTRIAYRMSNGGSNWSAWTCARMV